MTGRPRACEPSAASTRRRRSPTHVEPGCRRRPSTAWTRRPAPRSPPPVAGSLVGRVRSGAHAAGVHRRVRGGSGRGRGAGRRLRRRPAERRSGDDRRAGGRACSRRSAGSPARSVPRTPRVLARRGTRRRPGCALRLRRPARHGTLVTGDRASRWRCRLQRSGERPVGRRRGRRRRCRPGRRHDAGPEAAPARGAPTGAQPGGAGEHRRCRSGGGRDRDAVPLAGAAHDEQRRQPARSPVPALTRPRSRPSDPTLRPPGRRRRRPRTAPLRCRRRTRGRAGRRPSTATARRRRPSSRSRPRAAAPAPTTSGPPAGRRRRHPLRTTTRRRKRRRPPRPRPPPRRPSAEPPDDPPEPPDPPDSDDVRATPEPAADVATVQRRTEHGCAARRQPVTPPVPRVRPERPDTRKRPRSGFRNGALWV